MNNMKALKIFFCIMLVVTTVAFCGQVSPKEIQYHLSEVEKVETWVPETFSQLRGDYYAENGNSGGSLHLRFYNDPDSLKEYLDGCLITERDIAVKPEIVVIKGFYYDKEARAIKGGGYIFRPCRIVVAGNPKWIYGILVNNVFYELKR